MVVDFLDVVVELKFLRDLVRFFGRVKLAQVRTPSGIFQVFDQDETGSLVPDEEEYSNGIELIQICTIEHWDLVSPYV